MTQQSDKHLTTEQLSALLDAQLSQDEQAICKAHLRTCAQCRAALAALRQTVALLHALPTPELPRSFALPTNVTYLQERPQHEAIPVDTPSRPSLPAIQQRRPTPLRHSARILSTLVAVIGLFFLLPSLLGMLPHLGGENASTASSGSAVPAAAPQHTPAIRGAAHSTTSVPNKSAPSRTPVATPSPTFQNEPQATATQHPSSSLPPPILDINTPRGQQEVGITLFALGIVGIIVTRRRKQKI